MVVQVQTAILLFDSAAVQALNLIKIQQYHNILKVVSGVTADSGEHGVYKGCRRNSVKRSREMDNLTVFLK